MSKVVTVHGHTLELDMGFEIDEQLNTTWYKE